MLSRFLLAEAPGVIPRPPWTTVPLFEGLLPPPESDGSGGRLPLLASPRPAGVVKIGVRVFFGETAKAARDLARAAPSGLPASARRPPCDVAVRVYVLRASSLSASDGLLGGSASRDPYVRVRVGAGAGAAAGNAALPDEVGMARDDAQLQTLNPQFYRAFELATTLPGPSRLRVKVLDKDFGMFEAADDLVGELVVDVEARARVCVCVCVACV